MRPTIDPRTRRATAAVLALGLSYPLALGTPLGAPADQAAASAAITAGTLPAHLRGPAALSYGQAATVAGDLGAAGAGQPLSLLYQAAGTTTWSPVASGRAGVAGRYRLSARLPHSGSLRVLAGGGARAASTSPGGALSAALGVRVRAALGIERTHLDVFGGQRASVTGRLAPALPGAPVALQVRARSGWRTVARAHTGAQGRYRLAYGPARSGSEAVRVSFAGSGANAAAQRNIGRVNAFTSVQASWYANGGTTACGIALTPGTLGVANKTLPCGTMITLRYGGRTVRVPVIDRGPFVAGRDLDLSEATKNALGFPGTGPVWTTGA